MWCINKVSSVNYIFYTEKSSSVPNFRFICSSMLSKSSSFPNRERQARDRGDGEARLRLLGGVGGGQGAQAHRAQAASWAQTGPSGAAAAGGAGGDPGRHRRESAPPEEEGAWRRRLRSGKARSINR